MDDHRDVTDVHPRLDLGFEVEEQLDDDPA
jgi:hypothetical protein